MPTYVHSTTSLVLQLCCQLSRVNGWLGDTLRASARCGAAIRFWPVTFQWQRQPNRTRQSWDWQSWVLILRAVPSFVLCRHNISACVMQWYSQLHLRMLPDNKVMSWEFRFELKQA